MVLSPAFPGISVERTGIPYPALPGRDGTKDVPVSQRIVSPPPLADSVPFYFHFIENA